MDQNCTFSPGMRYKIAAIKEIKSYVIEGPSEGMVARVNRQKGIAAIAAKSNVPKQNLQMYMVNQGNKTIANKKMTQTFYRPTESQFKLKYDIPEIKDIVDSRLGINGSAH